MNETISETKDTSLEKAIKLFICTERLHRNVFDREVSCFNMHRSQHRMIMHLSRKEKPVSQKSLAEEFEISPAAVAVACKKLESMGFIKRPSSEDDNRVNNLVITDKGRELAEESMRVFKKIDALMFNGFTEKDLNSFITCLEKIQNNLKLV